MLLKNSAGNAAAEGAATGAPKIAVMGMLACPAATVSGSATTCPGAANVFLGGYSATEAAAGQKNIVTGYDGIKNAIQAINPNATVDSVARLHRDRRDRVHADRPSTRRRSPRRAATTR